MKICPYCEQDYLWLASITGTDESVVICPECDTTWEVQEQLVDGTGSYYEKFMTDRGYVADWKLIEMKSRVD